MAEKLDSLGGLMAGITSFNFSPGTSMPQQQKHATLCPTNELKLNIVCPSVRPIVTAAFAFWQLHWRLCEV
jgi:hypothetical protein